MSNTIKKWFTTTFTVKRFVLSESATDLEAQGTFDGYIEQATDDNLMQYAGLRLTKAFTVLCDVGTDVEEGDKLEEGGNKYDVRYKIDRDKGVNGHIQLLVEKIDG